MNFIINYNFTEKFFRKKAFLAVLAVVLVIKIIKVKIFWLLPLLVGVGTAKKLVLKFLLFLFPALSHIFKLCGYYHANYHKTNFHHHKHHIKHLHTVHFLKIFIVTFGMFFMIFCCCHNLRYCTINIMTITMTIMVTMEAWKIIYTQNSTMSKILFIRNIPKDIQLNTCMGKDNTFRT